MSELMQSLETHEVQKATKLLGLKISETELNELKSGNFISLENRGLSEIGSVFILAEALSNLNSFNKITFRDLPEVITESSRCSGIPTYYWNSEHFGKCCLLLTIVDGKPALKASYQKVVSMYL
jgi:hypothetical protein